MKHIEQWLAFTRRLQISILRKAEGLLSVNMADLKNWKKERRKVFDMLFHSCLSPDKRKVYEEKGACDTSFP